MAVAVRSGRTASSPCSSTSAWRSVTTTDDSVTVSTSTDTAGTRLHVLHNWSWDEATASPSSTVADMLRGGRHTQGEPVTLGPWDVRLFRSDETQDQRGSEDGS